ncbi:MAG: adenylosuccinate synthetase [Phycisphaerae bacterium]|nr:MAG: adenylosuccinate synthetase [Phycisphaerae bacterium]
MTAPAPSPSFSDRPAATAVVGLQWGDEGKGKLVDLLAREHDAVVRYNGGANAGHSVVVKGTRYSLHLIPSGILYPGKAAIIGNGVVVDPWKLVEELETLATRGVDTSSLIVSNRAHAVLPYHKAEDALREDLLKRAATERTPSGADRPDAPAPVSEIGTTRRGIGPAYADKVQRASAVRMGDLLRPDVLRDRVRVALTLKQPLFAAHQAGQDLDVDAIVESGVAIGRRLAPMIRETTYALHDLLDSGKRVLFEGANGTLLDVDHGTYPYVTGSTVVTAGIGSGTGVPPGRVGRVLGVMKAYSTRVGAGPMPTELHDAVGDGIRTRGREFGTTTGRPRRVGWLDLVAVRYAAMVNGATGLALTMLDVLGGMDSVHVCTAYEIDGERTNRFPADAYDLARAKPVYATFEGFRLDPASCRTLSDLSPGARRYVAFIEETVGVPADIVSVGPDREQTMFR